jgi:hypothetical protein
MFGVRTFYIRENDDIPSGWLHTTIKRYSCPELLALKGVLHGLLLHRLHISACISCSDVRTEKIRISKTLFFLSSSKFLFSRSVNQTNIQLYVHIRLHVQLYNVCTAVSYSCIRIQCTAEVVDALV